MDKKIRVIIPAYNEAASIGKVLDEIPAKLVAETIVIDNGSSDGTGEVAAKAGATVLLQPERGYGNACLKGMDYIRSDHDRETDIIVFMDADHSDFPEETEKVAAPILHDEADLVIGSRVLGDRERGSMTIPQVFGNWLATRLLRLLYGVRFTDLGPFRAIGWENLKALGMKDRNYGWTVEMQIKAAKRSLRCMEVPVRYRKRIGRSKVSGTLKGTVMAGYKIIWTLIKYS